MHSLDCANYASIELFELVVLLSNAAILSGSPCQSALHSHLRHRLEAGKFVFSAATTRILITASMYSLGAIIVMLRLCLVMWRVRISELKPSDDLSQRIIV